MATKAFRVLVLLASAAFGLPLTGDESLSIVAELPVAGAPGTLRALALGRGPALSLVSVTATNVQTWRVGSVSEPTVSPGGGRASAFADFDGDGLPDLAVLRGWASQPPGFLVLMRGNGIGLFEEKASIPLDVDGWAVAAADFDGDGRADVVLGTTGSTAGTATLRVYPSLGAFRLAAPRITPLQDIPNIGSVAAGDLDGDGLADAVVSQGMGPVSVWRNSGDGTFVATTRNLTGYYPEPPILADLDGDGRPELIYRNPTRMSPGWIVVCHNDGAGRFTESPGLTGEGFFGEPAVTDADGDGKADLVVRYGLVTDRIAVFPGNGHGGFGPEVRRALPAYGSLARADVLVPLDWDSDGRPEFVLLTDRGPVVLGPASPRVDLLAVSVLLSTTGFVGTRFDSDLLLTNAGDTTVHAELRYEAAAGGGSGAVTRDIEPGEQLLAPSAFGFLRDAGLPIPLEGQLVGTLRVSVSGAALPSAFHATVRTTSPGGAGVSYGDVPSLDAHRADAVVPWLVESGRDRTNLALVNSGTSGDGSVTLRVAVESGDPSAPGEAILPDVTLPPGGFHQFGHVLDASGLASRLGWARVSRVAGNAPFLAWAAVNDNVTGDGSFVPAVPAEPSLGSCQTIASVVQSGRYATELVVTNAHDRSSAVRATLAATGTLLEETLAPRQVWYVADLFAELRRRGLAGAPAADTPLASPLYVCSPYATRVLAGARVSTTSATGRFGLFEPSIPSDADIASSVVVPDLRQDDQVRTNLGIVNMSVSQTFRLEIFDGTTGRLVAMREGIKLAANELLQLNSVLRDLAPGTTRGWARVVPSSPGRFLAYGIVMDGAEPGLGSDDGSFILGLQE